MEETPDAWERAVRHDYLADMPPLHPHSRTMYQLAASVPWPDLEDFGGPRDIRRLGKSGYYVWDHTCGWISVRYYQVYASYDQARAVHTAHERICKLDWDEDGWYKAAPDWRAYVSWPVIR